MTRFLTNPVPSEPVPVELILGWSKLAIRVQSIFDQDLTDLAFSIDNTNILRRPYTTGFLELDFEATPGATYTLVVGSVDGFVGADNDLLMSGILGNSELVRTHKQEITFREYPVLNSISNTITSNAFSADNLVIDSSGFAEFMDVEYSTDNSNWASLYSGRFNPYLIAKLPLGSYYIRVRYSINIVTNVDVTPWQYTIVEITDLGTSIVEEIQDDLNQVVQDGLGDYSTTIEVSNLISNAISEVAEGFDEDPRLPIVEIVNNIFDNYETEVKAAQDILSEKVARETAILEVEEVIENESEIRATQITAVTAAINNEASQRSSQVAQLNQAIVDESTTRATQFNTVNAAVVTESQTRQAAVNELSEALVTETETRAIQINQVQAAITDETSARQAGIAQVNQAIADEAGARTTQINALTASVARETGQRQADIAQVNQAIADETSARASAVQQLNATIDGVSLATNSRIDSVEADVDGNAQAISAVEGAVYNPTTGLSASYSLAQTAKTTSDGNAVSITQIQNQVNNPTSGLSATFTQGVNNTNAINALQTRVNTVEGDVSQAELLLQSTVNDLGVVSSRAFLGVTTTVGGVSRINGIVVNGATNTMEFRADTLRLSDTSGNVQLYWNTEQNNWVFTGRIIGAGITGGFVRTADTTSPNVRVALSDSGGWPLWIGVGPTSTAGVPNENYLFRVDTSGLVQMRNAEIIGGTIRMIGTQAMSIESQTPFGPNNLLEWKGPKINGVTWNNSTQQVIFSGLTKANASYFYDANNQVYFSGSILAGTLRNAVQTTVLTAGPQVEVGPFGSNGGMITVKVSFGASRGTGVTPGTCPVEGNPSGTVYLDKWNGTQWIQVASQVMSGQYDCSQEGPEYVASWWLSGSFTFTDPARSTALRRFRARASHNVPLLPNGTLGLSLITEE